MRPFWMRFVTLAFSLAVCAASSAHSELVVRTPNLGAVSEVETIQSIKRALYSRRDVDGGLRSYDSGLLTLDRSWENSVLLKMELPIDQDMGASPNVEANVGIELTCQQCYVKGGARVTLSFDEPFNHTAYIENVKDEVKNFTAEVVDAAQNITEALFEGDFDFSEVQVDFTDINIPDPKGSLHIVLDGLDIYALLNTKLYAGATYTQTLLHTNTEFGLSEDTDLWLGAVIFVELILSAEAEIDLESGFHIELDDEVGIDIPMFGDGITSISFNGGQIEYLPVKFKGAGGSLKAALQVSARVGFNIAGSVDTPDAVDSVCTFVTNETCPNLSASAGIEVAVYATLFESETRLTADSGNETCQLSIDQTFQFAVGAIAGATVALGDLTLGPALETSTAIWTATFGTCALQPTATSTTALSPTITARGEVAKRDTTVLSTEVAITAVGCESAGMINCPVSLQTMTVYTTTLSLTTDVDSDDAEPTFPATTQNTLVTTIPFGTQAKRLPSTTGLPKAFTAQPSSDPNNPFGDGADSSTDSSNGNNDKSTSNKKPLIIGLSVGLGVPVLAGLIGIIIFLCRRNSQQKGALVNTANPAAQPLMTTNAQDNDNAKKGLQASVAEATE